MQTKVTSASARMAPYPMDRALPEAEDQSPDGRAEIPPLLLWAMPPGGPAGAFGLAACFLRGTEATPVELTAMTSTHSASWNIGATAWFQERWRWLPQPWPASPS